MIRFYKNNEETMKPNADSILELDNTLVGDTDGVISSSKKKPPG